LVEDEMQNLCTADNVSLVEVNNPPFLLAVPVSNELAARRTCTPSITKIKNKGFAFVFLKMLLM
jgi:hypothetical protein